MLSPHAEKWGDASPHPPPIDARGCTSLEYHPPSHTRYHLT